MNIVTRGARYASVDLLLDSGYLWLARDLNGSIAAYSHKPFKLDDEVWRVEEGESKEMWMWVDDGDLYNFVKWEDDEPVNIREWFKKEEEEMKLYYVRDGQLESKDVDVDFFEKATTLGGLLTSDEVELDRDNELVPIYPGDAISDNDTTLGGMLASDGGDMDNRIVSADASNWGESRTSAIEALAKIDLKFRGVDNMKKHDFKIGDIIRRRGSDEEFIICDIVHEGEGLVSQSRRDVSVRTTFFYASVEKVPSPPKATIQVDASNWGKSRTAAIEAAKDYMDKGIGHPWVTYTPVTPKFDPDNVHAHLEVCGELNVTYERKNADYGDSFAQSLDKHGLIAAIVRMDDKMNRVINLYKADERLVEDESIRDTLMDLANYAIMSVMWLDTESCEESDGGYISPTEYNPVALLDSDSYLLAPGEAFRAGFGAGISGSNDRDIYADNQKLDIDKALREGAHPQAIRDFLGGADYDGDTTNS